MTKFKPGDRVMIYHGQHKAKAILSHMDSMDAMWFVVLVLDGPLRGMKFHEKQMRKLVKKKRREWWINEKVLRNNTLYNQHVSWNVIFEVKSGAWLSTTKPENTDGWICVREVKK